MEVAFIWCLDDTKFERTLREMYAAGWHCTSHAHDSMKSGDGVLHSFTAVLERPLELKKG
jgi:hypothetical protein